ncbi:MAG: HTH-type transcriptional regulator/antitoxin HipB [Alphaproteobacteria bacterium]|jgi:HTH-type transcriptional regulator/antitoxin HipB
MENNISDTKELASVIKDARKEQGMTQDDLAGLTGTGRRFISDLEKGKDTAQLGKVLLVLGALGIGLYAFSKWKK